ncbi:hypothetical protein ABTD52_18220, partial [Acinetobacter baumannii]
GRFVALAQTRLAAITVQAAGASAPSPRTRPEAQAPAVQALAGRPEMLPRPGDTWRYRVQDQFRLGDLYVTAKVDAVTVDGV